MKTKLLLWKRTLRSVLLVLLLSALGMTKTYAYDFSAVCETGQTLYYNITDATNYYVALVAPGGNSYSGWSGFTKPTGDIILPESVQYDGSTYSVTSIGGYAFYNCTGITNLVIGEGLTYIGERAFGNCNSLTEVYYNASNCGNASYDFPPFQNCSGTLVIGNSVETIPNYMFYNSGFEGTLTLPNSVTSIGNSAFYNCSGLTSLTIGNSVTSIGNSAFSGCSGLTSLTIGNSVTSIGNSAFSGCSGLTSLTLPNSVTAIGNAAFYGCSGLNAVNYTGDINNWCNISFLGYNCNPLYYAHNLFINNELVTNLIIHETVTEIKPYAFHGATCLTSLTLPNSVTAIGNAAFYGCNGLNAVNYTGNINNWCNISFSDYNSNPLYYAHNLFIDNELVTNLVIPETVTEIKPYAFYGATCLTSLTIGNSVTSIGTYAFSGCNGLNAVNYTGNINNWCNISFSDYNSNPLYYAHNLFIDNELMTDLVIPETITEIKPYAFRGATCLTSLTLPNSVTAIGEDAFEDCTGLTSLTLPNSVTSIGGGAFYGCTGINYIISFAENPPTVMTYSFYLLNTNAFVCVPCGFEDAYASLSWGGFSNFHGMCGGPITVAADPVEGGTVTDEGTLEFVAGQTNTVTATANEGYCFANWTLNGAIVSYDAEWTFFMADDMALVAHFVPESNIVFADATVKAICVAQWDANNDGELSYAEAAAVTDLGNYFSGNPEITSFDELQYFIGLSSICASAFSNCSGLTSFTFPNFVTSIGSSAFSGCSSLCGDLIIPNSVTTIGWGAFGNCSGFTGDLIIPNSVTTIGMIAFCNCSGFTGDLTIGNSVTTIGREAFRNCSGFTGNLTIGNSVTTIGESAFRDCSGFTGDLTIGNSVTSISDYAFYNCSGFTGDLIIPNSVTTIGECAFRDCSGFTGDLTIGNSVTTIGEYAFRDCSGFTGNLTIGNSVTSIGNFAFIFCNGFTEVFFNATNYPEFWYPYGGRWYSPLLGCGGSITIGDNVERIPAHMFYYVSAYYFGADPEYMEISCFSGRLTIGNSVTSIGEGAFYGCDFTEMRSFAETPPSVDVGFYVDYAFLDPNIPFTVPCGTIEAYQNASVWNEFTNIQEDCSHIQTQTVTLSEGWNWFSTNVETTLDDLKSALVEALPGTNITIKSRTQNIAYNPNTNQWRGTLNALDVSQMYMISVGNDCEITLEGMPVNPSEYSVTIHNGANWIAFPFIESMTISNAFAGFAINGDVIKSRNTNSSYINGQWRGGLNTLEPGRGYIYKSNATDDRIFTFPIRTR